MTYLQFHALFLLPPLAALGWAVARSADALPERTLWAVPSLIGIALVYTTPWDNYLVYRGVWSYGADRVVGTIGWVPIEEYLFFVLQPLGVGLLLVYLLARGRAKEAEAKLIDPGRSRGEPGSGARRRTRGGRRGARVRTLGAAVYLAAATIGGAALVAGGRFTYAGLILAWASPVLAAQWWFAAPAAARHPRAFAHALLWPTLYLWAADRTAIADGIWSVAAETSTGASLLGLPVEEALFFLATNLLVVQGLLWLLAPEGNVTFRDARRRVPSPVST